MRFVLCVLLAGAISASKCPTDSTYKDVCTNVHKSCISTKSFATDAVCKDWLKIKETCKGEGERCTTACDAPLKTCIAECRKKHVKFVAAQDTCTERCTSTPHVHKCDEICAQIRQGKDKMCRYKCDVSFQKCDTLCKKTEQSCIDDSDKKHSECWINEASKTKSKAEDDCKPIMGSCETKDANQRLCDDTFKQKLGEECQRKCKDQDLLPPSISKTVHAVEDRLYNRLPSNMPSTKLMDLIKQCDSTCKPSNIVCACSSSSKPSF